MTRSLGLYAGSGLVLLAAATTLAWPWVEADGRRGLVAAGAVAWSVQVVAFGLLLQHRCRPRRFLAVWAGGTLIRMAVVGVAAFAATRITSLATAPTLLGLAGFFFGLLLLEPLFFGGHSGERSTREGT